MPSIYMFPDAMDSYDGSRPGPTTPDGIASQSSKLFAGFGDDQDDNSVLALSFESRSTSSGRVGVGSTLDRILSRTGKRLTDFISMFAERYLGMGPNALLARALHPSLSHNRKCCNSRCVNSRSNFKAPSPAVSVLKARPSFDTLIELLCAPYCRTCRNYYAQCLLRHEQYWRACKKLVKDLKAPNSAVQRLAADYITTLVCFYPDFRSVFLQIGANDALRDMRNDAQLWQDHVLLVPSRRALICVSDSNLIGTIKEMDALNNNIHIEDISISFGNVIYSEVPTRMLDCIYTIIGYVTLAPHLQVMATSRITSYLDQSYRRGSHFCHCLDRLNVRSLWHQIAISPDPIVRGILGWFIRSTYRVGVENMKWILTLRNRDQISDFDHCRPAREWHYLWMPLFHLRVNMPHIISRIPEAVLKDVCERFEPRMYGPVASLLDNKSKKDIHDLATFVTGQYCNTPNVGPRDPVLCLLQQITSPLFLLCGEFYREQKYIWHLSWTSRSMPLSRLHNLCGRLVDLLARSPIPYDRYDVLHWLWAMRIHKINAPASYQILLDMVKPLAQSSPRLMDDIIWAMKDHNLRGHFRCSGIVAVEKSQSRYQPLTIFHLLPDQRKHIKDSNEHCMRLVLPRHLIASHLFWVPYSDITLRRDVYQPIIAGGRSSTEKKCCIGYIRDDLVWGSRSNVQLIMLSSNHFNSQQVHADDGLDTTKLFILALSTFDDASSIPIFWMTKTHFVHAITQEERPNLNDLDIDKVVDSGFCDCELHM